jgi:ABC-type multidrug transport system fused ATPase/permease subunit
MEDLQRRSKQLEKRVKKLDTQLEKLFDLRLIIIVVLFFGLAASIFVTQYYLEVLLIVTLVPAFVFFVFRSNRLRRHQEQLKSLNDFYMRQFFRNKGTYRDPNAQTAPEALEFDRHLANDLDLFGSYSLESQISEAFTDGGRLKLLQEILSAEPSIERIEKKQAETRLASQYIGFFRRLVVIGKCSKGLAVAKSTLLDSIKRSSLPSHFKTKYYLIFSIYLLAVIEIVLRNLITTPPSIVVFPLLFVILSLVSLGWTGRILDEAQTLSRFLEDLAGVFTHLEKGTKNKELCPLFPAICKNPPSGHLKRINKLISYLSIRNNPLVFFIANVVFPWNLHFGYLFDKSRQKLAQDFPPALDELYQLESILSRAMMYHYQTQTMPEFTDTPAICAQDLEHPLIESNSRVSNSLEIKADDRVILITGSNMSGKSTFLRTLGLNQILANMGAPVFAKSFTTFAAPIVSCIRNTDSLEEGYSYFYYEVRRLKEIIEKVEKDQPLLFLVDEIFKGTNNHERFLGAKALILHLAKYSSIGLISTHDLDLCQLSQDNLRIVNHHFRDDIKDGKMHFSYKILHGPCPTTNALRIMKREGLPVVAGESDETRS